MQELKKGFQEIMVARDLLKVLNLVEFGPHARKLFFYLASNVHASADSAFQEFRLTVNDFVTITGCDAKDPYQSLDKAFTDLSTSIVYHDKPNKVKIYGSIVNTKYEYGNGSGTLSIHKDMTPLMLAVNKLIRGYVGVATDFFIESKKEATIILYLLLRAKFDLRNTTQKITFSLEEFRELTGNTKKHPRTNLFAQRFIDPAIKEINQSPNCILNISWDWEKKGATITGLIFIASQKTSEERTPEFDFKSAYKKSKTQEWLESKLNYTQEDYEALQEHVKHLKTASILDDTEAIFKDFPWWNRVTSSPKSHQTFRLHLVAYSMDYGQAANDFQELAYRELDGRAKEGAIITKLREMIWLRGENTGAQFRKIKENPMLLEFDD